MTSTNMRFSTKMREKGTAIIEFALIAPLFFFLLFAIVDFGVLYWANLTMQYAVREGARYAVTGQSNLDPNTANQQRYLAVIQMIKDSSMGIYGQVNPTLAIAINGGTPQSYGTPAQYNTGMFGGPGDIIALQLDCTWPILTPLVQPYFSGGVYRFSVGATMRNEAFQ